LLRSLTGEGHDVCRLVRSERAVDASEVAWQPDQGVVDEAQLEGFEAVIHLAGESISSGRWTDDKKRAIRDSRVKGTQLLSESLAGLKHPPATLICASAVGYYGDRGDELLTEQSAPGNDFLADVCVEWERATEPASRSGIRTINARFGIILDKEGGALAKMLPPFRMGIGGRIGDGKQWMSWIALEDVVGGLKHALATKTLNGPLNFVAPNPSTNSEFTRILGRALGRPTFFPVPAFGARIAFGEMADALLLSSQRVKPQALQASGFDFKHVELAAALRRILAA
jgi:uncharacterized protein (TIGR01777 family)